MSDRVEFSSEDRIKNGFRDCDDPLDEGSKSLGKNEWPVEEVLAYCGAR